jgi:erythromycin esterase-like protein
MWQAFGDAIYNVAFTTYEGQRGWVGREPNSVAAPQTGSLEDIWGATRRKRAFLDLRRVPLGGEWLREPSYGYPTGDQISVVDWRQMFDGVVFLRTMRPARPAT